MGEMSEMFRVLVLVGAGLLALYIYRSIRDRRR